MNKYVISISNKEINFVNQSGYLENENLSQLIEPRALILFFNNNYLYGFYNVKAIISKKIYFARKKTKSCLYNYKNDKRAIFPPKEAVRAINIFKNETSTIKKLFLSIQETDSFFRALLMAENEQRLIYFNECLKSAVQQKVIKDYLLSEKNPLVTDSQLRKDAKDLTQMILGMEIFNILNSKAKESKKNSIVIDNDSSLRTGMLSLSHTFLREIFPITHYHPLVPLKRENKSGLSNIAIVIPEQKRDEYMKIEATKLSNIFLESSDISFLLLDVNIKKANFLRTLEDYEIVHYIGHGSREGLLLDDDLLSEQSLCTVNHFPRILILSCCVPFYNLNLIKRFFEKGGEVLICTNGEVSSSEMESFFSNFYWQAIHRKIALYLCFFSSLGKVREAKNLNRRIEFHGDTKSKFFSKI